MSSIPISRSILDPLKRRLESLEEESQLRHLDGVRGVNLCSNDYLGLAGDERLKSAVARASETHAVSSTGSRLLSGNSSIWEETEARFASFVGAEGALYFSSGYLANIGLLSSIADPGDTFFSDAANHASIIDGIRLSKARKVVFPHGDLNFLEDSLRSAPASGSRFIVVESLFSMDGDRAPLRELALLADRYAAGLIVDEAHATGVFGDQGQGLVAASGRPECILATVHTCGKALASMGAFVAGSKVLCEYLVNRARTFIFSTASPPYMAQQILQALNLVSDATDRRRKLFELASLLRRLLQTRGYSTTPSDAQILPIVLGTNEAALAVAQGLEREGFGVKAIRPPTVPSGTARLRVSLTCNLTVETIGSFVQALDRVTAAVRL